METKFTARHFKASPELQQEAIDNARNFEKFYDGIISVDIVLVEESSRENLKSAEYIVHVQDHTIVAKETAEDYYKSIHAAAEKVVRQLRKLKTKASKDLHQVVNPELLEEEEEVNPTEEML